MRAALTTLLFFALLTGAGCEQSQPVADAQTTPASEQEKAEQQTTAAKPQSQQSDADAASGGNIITKNLPRFHDEFESDEAFLVWRETFYIHRQFDRLPQAIGYFCASDLYEDIYNRTPMAAFVGVVLKQSDQAVDHCWDELMLEGREDELMTYGYGLWLANTPYARQIYFNARQIWDNENLIKMFHMQHQAQNLDTMDRPDNDFRVIRMLWCEFYATGDEQRLRRVINLSYMHNAPEGSWQSRTGQSAMSSLVRLLPYDPLVRRLTEEEAANNEMTQIRTHLSRLLEDAGQFRERPGSIPSS